MEDLNSVVLSLDFIERILIRSGGITEGNMARDISRAKDALRQLERERDAAVKGLGEMRWCSMCKHSGTDDLTCVTCKYPPDVYPTFRPNWQWRGVQKEVE